MPENFDHYAYGEGGRLKFLRIQTLKSNGDSRGYNDLYFDKKGASQPYKWIYEGENRWSDVGSLNNPPKKEQWQSNEMSVTLDNVPASTGGIAKIGNWIHGRLLREISALKTLGAVHDYSIRTF